MTCPYVEILGETRTFEANAASTNHTIVLVFKIPDEDEQEGPLAPNATFLGDDRDIIALELAYSILPKGRWVPNANGEELFLILTTAKLREQTKQDWWKVEATYVYDTNTGVGGQRPSPDSPEIALPFIRIGFSVGNQTQTVTQSRELLSAVSVEEYTDDDPPVLMPPKAIPNTGTAIGVTEDGIQGAEVYSPGLMLQVTAYYFPKSLTHGFISILADMFPAVNDAPFLGREAGEVLITGCDGEATINDIIPISYSMIVKKNLNDLPDPPFPNITAPAHAIVDYRYVKNTEEVTGTPLNMPTYRFIHRHYDPKDLSKLGFPVS